MELPITSMRILSGYANSRGVECTTMKEGKMKWIILAAVIAAVAVWATNAHAKYPTQDFGGCYPIELAAGGCWRPQWAACLLGDYCTKEYSG
jgi:hypothetical protein